MPNGYTEYRGVTVSISAMRALRRGYFRVVPGTKRETRVYNLYRCMMGRCFNQHHPNFEYYGAKGIGVCAEWQADYEVFRAWCIRELRSYPGDKRDASIDRRDEKGDYEPDNCRLLSLNQNRLRALHGDQFAGVPA